MPPGETGTRLLLALNSKDFDTHFEELLLMDFVDDRKATIPGGSAGSIKCY
jgi:hypothetical protein